MTIFHRSFFHNRMNRFRTHSIVLYIASILLCIGAALNTFPVTAQNLAPTNLTFERLTADQGLSQGRVICMLQDRRGFMWFGTEEGLNRYDGIGFKQFTSSNKELRSLPSNYIEALYEDKEGVIWVGTKSGLARFDRTSETFTHYRSIASDPASLPTSYVTSIVDDITGAYLWVGTYGGGLARLDKATQKFTNFRKSIGKEGALQSDIVWRLTADKAGAVWAGTYKGGLYRFMAQSNTFLCFVPDSSEASKSAYIQSLCADHNGIIWMGTDQGLWKFEYLPVSRTGTFTRYTSDPANPAALRSSTVQAVLEDRAGRIWAGTKNGLHLFDRATEQFRVFQNDPTDPNSLINDEIISLYEDRSGTIWLGTANGISYFNPRASKFATYRTEAGRVNSLSSNVVWSFAEMSDGRVWVGTESGLNRLESKPLSGVNTFSTFRKNDNLPNQLQDDFVSALCTTRDGTLWIGTDEGGLYAMKRTDVYGLGDFTSYLSNDADATSLSSNTISCIIEDKRGKIWIGTANGVSRLDGIDGTGKAMFARFTSNPANLETSLINPAVYTLYEDRQGMIWAGTDNGLTRIEPSTGAMKSYRVTDGATGDPSQISADDNAIQVMYESKDGTMWIGTQGGLTRFDRASGKFAEVTMPKEVGLNNARTQALKTILGILEDNAGNLWLSTNTGLWRYTPSTNGFRCYDVRDGLQGKEFITGAAFKDKHGVMYFGGVNGFNAFHPDSMRNNSTVPPVVITGFTRFDTPVQLDSSITEKHTIILPYNQNTFEITFAALSYSFASRNRYRYRLLGLDKDDDWHYSSTKFDARYTSLPPGDYTFQVQACNYDEEWNTTGATLTIEIRPPFWATWWFRILAGTVLIGGVVGGVRWRVKAIEDQNKRLAVQVEERTKQWREANELLTGANEEITRQNEVLQEQAGTIELAHTGLQEKNLVIEKTLTDLKQAQMQLVQSEKMASLGQLTAGVAHEINNPVNFISGAVKPLKRNIAILTQTIEQYSAIQPENISPETITALQQQVRDIQDFKEEAQLGVRLQQIDDLVGNIGVGAERIAEIVKILRNFSRLDEGALKRVSLHEGIDASLRLLQNQFKNRPVNIVKNYGDVPEVMCFAGPINQVFMNIIHNAIQAIKDTGEVRISTLLDPANAQNIIVQITDTGVGMPPDVQKRIFEPFFTTKEAGVGTGLGLSISADIVAKHQGSIRLKSEIGVGTEFSIVLPIDGPKFS
jgi:ligand-binding sensor domain-containing protein